MQAFYIQLPHHFAPSFIGRRGARIRNFSTQHKISYANVDENDVLALFGKEDSLVEATKEVRRLISVFNERRPNKWKDPRYTLSIHSFDFPIYLQPYNNDRFIITKKEPLVLEPHNPFRDTLNRVDNTILVNENITSPLSKRQIEAWLSTLTENEVQQLQFSATIGKITYPSLPQKANESSHCYLPRLHKLSAFDQDIGTTHLDSLSEHLTQHGFRLVAKPFSRLFHIPLPADDRFEVYITDSTIDCINHDWDKLIDIRLCNAEFTKDIQITGYLEQTMTWQEELSDENKIFKYLAQKWPQLPTFDTTLVIEQVHTEHITIYQRHNDVVKLIHRVDDDLYTVHVSCDNVSDCIYNHILHLSDVTHEVKHILDQ